MLAARRIEHAKGRPMAKRVLVVDDHAPTRSLIRSILDAEKGDVFEVVEAGNGVECLKAADSNGPFDLILLDVNLPDVDGFEVCRGLRRVDPRVPIVFVTGKGELRDYASGRDAGGDSYLVKPIARASLRSIVGLFTSVDRNSSTQAKPEPSEK
jgi:DNA-binding response OmpR family regulator